MISYFPSARPRKRDNACREPGRKTTKGTTNLNIPSLMGLIQIAERAQDVAAALNKFLVPVADFSADITALISELFRVSVALRELDTAAQNTTSKTNHSQRKKDTQIVVYSLVNTFRDVEGFFQEARQCHLRPGLERARFAPPRPKR